MIPRVPSIQVLLASSFVILTVPSCDDQPRCPYGEWLARKDNGVYGEWVCVARNYSTDNGSSDSSSSTSQDSAPTTASPSTSAYTTSSDAGTSAPSKAPDPACGGLAATSDDVRVVDKTESAPTLSQAASDLADGMYQLVQASFYQSTAAESAIRSLRATLSIRGRTLILGAQDTTVAGHPAEALTFLFQNGDLTKTCDVVGGGVSSWFFPFPVGQGEAAKAEYDGDAGFVRLIIPRSDGATELVFSK